MITDPIADMLTRIRNGQQARFSQVDIPSSKIKVNIAKILKEEGFIKNLDIQPDNRQGVLRVYLRYDEEANPLINGIRRVSKPSCRIYVRAREIPPVLSGLGVSILSTSKGLMTDRQARRENVGGELLCSVW
ncbi:MAG: 30S ribosomal protein S8 [Proteobacteria bacterium]|nr:30S ribosomal protein S8 [Pseudomonadota bacterium]MBU1740332.1 30S ribosomal protein S8 [Pseudomonadota bacterium]